MNQLELLAVALGLASLAGLNLYLTVFVTGLSIQQGWIVLDPAYASLHVLGHPAIIAVAGLLYFLEFFADKINWVDSLWDSVHTIIRPVGAAFLSIQLLGATDSVFEIIVILLSGGVALTTHTLKAGTRLVANTSPEPFTNVGLSIAEDVAVIGGLALLNYNPLLALGIFAAIIAAILWFAPVLLRAARARVWLVWKKLNSPAASDADTELPTHLPSHHDIIFNRLTVIGERIEWSVPCISGPSRGIPSNLRGYLIATRESPSKLYFVAKRSWRHVDETIDLAGFKVSHEPKFLSENLVLYRLDKGPRYTFVFDRTKSALVEKLARSIRARLEERVAAPSTGPAEGTPSHEPELAAVEAE